AAVDVRDPHVGRPVELARDVGDAAEGAVEVDLADPALAGGDLLDGSAGDRYAEQVRGPSDPGAEVEMAAVGGPVGPARVQVEVGREVDGLPARDGLDVDVLLPAVAEAEVDDHVRAEGAYVGPPAAVRREVHTGVVVAVLG